MLSSVSGSDDEAKVNAKALAPFIGRAAIACLFLASGIAKLAVPKATIAYIASTGLPFPQLGLLVAVSIEVGGGLLLALGLFTRPVAAAMAAFSIVTALLFHSDLSDQMQFIQFLKNVAIAGGLMQVLAFGPGRLSVDARHAARLGRSRSAI